MKKKDIIFGVLLLLVVLTASGVSGTYARYAKSDDGVGVAPVAKWAVVFKDSSGTELKNTESSTL